MSFVGGEIETSINLSLLAFNGIALTSTTGNINAQADFFTVGINTQLRVVEGSSANAIIGRATLVGGTVTVSTNRVTAMSEILITSQIPGGTPGFLGISARTPGVSFAITSSSGTDTSQVGWLIVERV